MGRDKKIVSIAKSFRISFNICGPCVCKRERQLPEMKRVHKLDTRKLNKFFNRKNFLVLKEGGIRTHYI